MGRPLRTVQRLFEKAALSQGFNSSLRQAASPAPLPRGSHSTEAQMEAVGLKSVLLAAMILAGPWPHATAIARPH